MAVVAVEEEEIILLLPEVLEDLEVVGVALPLQEFLLDAELLVLNTPEEVVEMDLIQDVALEEMRQVEMV
jgi:hypothetical protein